MNVKEERPSDSWSPGEDWPIVVFVFYKGDKIQGSLCVGYGTAERDFFYDQGDIHCRLHPTTVRRLREWVSQHPQVLKALTIGGAKSAM